jgi:hypothetical protein
VAEVALDERGIVEPEAKEGFQAKLHTDLLIVYRYSM